MISNALSKKNSAHSNYNGISPKLPSLLDSSVYFLSIKLKGTPLTSQ
ncbi:hypothetical protein SXCC_01397 [Gluconacetobacter sp. SXCC-1]|nr:hypothetical protein SXCC_01397 [Gluconacetobacter sp. SXCC-1]